MTGAKKVVSVKNELFHAHQPREGIFEIYSYRGLIFELFSQNFELLFPNFDGFFQKYFWPKSLLMVSTSTGLMGSGIRQSCKYSIIYYSDCFSK